MTHKRIATTYIFATLALLILLPALACAQTEPATPIRIVLIIAENNERAFSSRLESRLRRELRTVGGGDILFTTVEDAPFDWDWKLRVVPLLTGPGDHLAAVSYSFSRRYNPALIVESVAQTYGRLNREIARDVIADMLIETIDAEDFYGLFVLSAGDNNLDWIAETIAARFDLTCLEIQRQEPAPTPTPEPQSLFERAGIPTPTPTPRPATGA